MATESREARYMEALRLHVSYPREESLAAAWSLGREFLAAGTGLLDLAAMHHRCLAALLQDAALNPLHDLPRAEQFYTELLSPFEMGQRAFQEANAALREAYQDLELRNRELLHANAETEQARQELESFSYSVSHDLRAPLRSIDGFAAILDEDESGRLSEQGRQNLRRIRDAAARMSQLVEDLLRLAKISRAGLQHSAVDLSALAREVLLALELAQPGRRVSWKVAEGLKAEGDPMLLKIALENLLGNAWKFTQKKEQAEIQVGQAVQGKSLGYYVRDNGAGLDLAYAARLFQPFQRLHSAQEFEGTGIGLATVKRIISRHGGRAWCESEPGKGATFYFTLWDAESKKA